MSPRKICFWWTCIFCLPCAIRWYTDSRIKQVSFISVSHLLPVISDNTRLLEVNSQLVLRLKRMKSIIRSYRETTVLDIKVFIQRNGFLYFIVLVLRLFRVTRLYFNCMENGCFKQFLSNRKCKIKPYSASISPQGNMSDPVRYQRRIGKYYINVKRQVTDQCF